MKSFKVYYQNLKNGKPTSSAVACVTVNANTKVEAKGRFKIQHPNGNVRILNVEEV